jgi:uncharacterized membrane protein YgcG
MAKIAGAVFGVPDLPSPAPEEKPEKTEIDPNRQAELAAAAKRRRSIFSRRGRSFLKSGGATSGGVSVGGGGAKPGAS